MAKEPPWKYLAGIDTSDGTMLKRCMVMTLFRLKGLQALGKRIKTMAKPSDYEQTVIDTMFDEISQSPLLERLTLEWARYHDKPTLQIFAATDVLKRDATFYVRRPMLYKEEYKVAEEAFNTGGWVYMGKVVHWEKIPEEEVKRSKKVMAKRAKMDAMIDDIEYVPDPGMEDVQSDTEDDKNGQAVVEDEVETEDGETDDPMKDVEDQDDDADEDYQDRYMCKPKGRKRVRSVSDEDEEEEDWEERKPIPYRKKVCSIKF